MSDTQKESAEQKQAKDKFVRETIASSKGRTGRVIRRILLTLGLALVFGISASLAFVVSRPYWESRFNTTEATTPEPITIFPETTPEPTTETPTPTVPTETSAETESASEQESTDREALESLWDELSPSVQAMIDGNKMDIADVEAMYEARRAAVAEADKSIVTVTSKEAATDIFGNPISSSSDSCGVVLAVTDSEILILTDKAIAESTGKVYVNAEGTSEQEGSVKQVDGIYGIAVISVPVASYSEAELAKIVPVTFGYPYMIQQGQQVLILGRPMGYKGSVSYGIVTYINSSIQGTDSMVKIFQTDVPYTENCKGAMFNLHGEMIGWVTDKYTSSSVSELITALAINTLQPSIERLSNGEAMCMLGIRGQMINTPLTEDGDPVEGIYINKCVSDSPAENAGLQSGDVLIAADEKKITAFNHLTSVLSAHREGDSIRVSVLRKAPEGYVQMDFSVTLSRR